MLHTAAGECVNHFVNLCIQPPVSIPLLEERAEGQNGWVACRRTHNSEVVELILCRALGLKQQFWSIDVSAEASR